MGFRLYWVTPITMLLAARRPIIEGGVYTAYEMAGAMLDGQWRDFKFQPVRTAKSGGVCSDSADGADIFSVQSRSRQRALRGRHYDGV